MATALHILVISVGLLFGSTSLISHVGVPLDAIRPGSERTVLDSLGVRNGMYLERPVELHDVFWDGWIWMDDNGNVLQGRLAQKLPVGEIVLPIGTTVFLYEDCSVKKAWLPRDMSIDGIPVKGGFKIETGFWPNGRLRFCFLDDDQHINGFPCHASTLSIVRFDSTGNLLQCTLEGDYLYDQSLFRAGTELWLSSEGDVLKYHRPGWFSRMGRALLEIVL